jgi:hypothetical protein
MIFLEQTVYQILQEEGQLVITLDDLGLTWKHLENLFVGIYEQSKGYLTIYDWEKEYLNTTPKRKDDWAHIRHLTYNTAYNMQKIMPDIARRFYEFNPYTKNASSLMHSNFSVDAAKYPTLEQLDYSLTLTGKAGRKVAFRLPCLFDVEDFKLLDMKAVETTGHHNCLKEEITFAGESGSGEFDTETLTGFIKFKEDTTATLSVVSKYVGIKELDLTCELFYIWFKSALLTLIGSMKKQIDLQGVQLPFDLNGDDILARGRELSAKVEELKTTKMHWSNF